MEGLLYSDEPQALWTFLVFTLVLGGLAAWATGRALAGTWRSIWTMPLALIILAGAVRFLHYALSGEDLLSVHYYLVSLVVIIIGAAYGYRSRRAEQMVRQYPWLFAKSGLLGWTTRPTG